MSTRENLLVTMAEADASHRPEREQFFMSETFGGSTIGHPALPDGEVKVNKPDVLDLIELGYLRPTYGNNVVMLDVSDAGFREASKAKLSEAMSGPESEPITAVEIGAGKTSYSRIPEDERKRLSKFTDFGWHIGFSQEPDRAIFWAVADENGEILKTGVADEWQDALIECVMDLVPPSGEK